MPSRSCSTGTGCMQCDMKRTPVQGCGLYLRRPMQAMHGGKRRDHMTSRMAMLAHGGEGPSVEQTK
eukprot:5823630-Pyramimonas_sp.AAC.1